MPVISCPALNIQNEHYEHIMKFSFCHFTGTTSLSISRTVVHTNLADRALIASKQLPDGLYQSMKVMWILFWRHSTKQVNIHPLQRRKTQKKKTRYIGAFCGIPHFFFNRSVNICCMQPFWLCTFLWNCTRCNAFLCCSQKLIEFLFCVHAGM